MLHSPKAVHVLQPKCHWNVFGLNELCSSGTTIYRKGPACDNSCLYMLSLPIKLENVLRQAVKKWSSAFYFQNFKTTHDRFWGGGVNYQMQIVTTKLPNENIQTYKLQMIDSGEGELPNANCDYQTTKWKYPNLLITNDWFWEWGGG